MTSLSNIFRPIDLTSSRPIQVRDLRKEIVTDSEEVTMDMVMAERDELLKVAYSEIDHEKNAVESMRIAAIDEIESMRAAWDDEKKELQQQAYEEAFQEGYEEGHNKALSDMSESLGLTNQIVEQSKKNAEKYQESQERVILEIAMAAASKVLGIELEENDEKYLAVVRRAIKEVREMPEIKLYVSTEYYELVSENRAELASIFPPDVPFLLFVNEEFEATDCFIETNQGRIVVSVDEQLNELREQLIEIQESGD